MFFLNVGHFTGLHGVISQRMEIFMAISVRISNPAT
jgi:hypothetical protein